MTTVFLVRHGVHDLLDRVLVGRSPGVGLSPLGQRQARQLATRLAPEGVTAVQSSPQLRARETAELIADALGLAVEVVPALDELDAGEWTGRAFAELEQDPRWRSWNASRSTARPPGGESMGELQRRVLGHIEAVAARHADDRLVVVSHAEPIRAALLHYGRLHLDDFLRVPIDPASLTTLRLDAHGGEVIGQNEAIASSVAA